MIIIPAKFQPSSSTGMGGKWDDIGRKRGDRRTRDVTPFSHDPYTKKWAIMKILNFPPRFAKDG